jgi:hypothetical protein
LRILLRSVSFIPWPASKNAASCKTQLFHSDETARDQLDGASTSGRSFAWSRRSKRYIIEGRCRHLGGHNSLKYRSGCYTRFSFRFPVEQPCDYIPHQEEQFLASCVFCSKNDPKGFPGKRIARVYFLFQTTQVWEEGSTLRFEYRPRGPVNIEIFFETGDHGDGQPFDGPGIDRGCK